MNPTIKKGIYQHYKGNKQLYETEFGKDTLWVRLMRMFKEDVIVDRKTVKRFVYVEKR